MMWVIEKYVKYIVIFVVLWVLLGYYRNFSCAKVYTRAMSPTLESDAFFLVSVGVREPHELAVGDLVHFQYDMGERFKTFVARIIAMPGQMVSMEKGQILVNGSPLAEPYVNQENILIETRPPIQVPRDHYYLLNDNRKDLTQDSRQLGPISKHSILGKLSKY